MAEIERKELEQIIGHISEVAVKHWLKVSGLEYSAQNTDAYYERLQKLMRKGKLSSERLKQVALEIEENANKRIYLRQIEIPKCLKSQPDFEKHLKLMGIQLGKLDISIRYPKIPTLNYVYWSDKEIKIKYSETQTHIIPNIETRGWDAVQVTNYAIAILDLNSGFTQIRLDPAVNVHSHKDPKTKKSKELLYLSYYFDEFSKILGNCEFQMYDLIKATEYLVKTKPYIFQLPLDSGLCGDASHYRFSNKKDVRDGDAYKAAAEADRDLMSEKLSGYWIPEESTDQISRSVFMNLDRKSSMIGFYRDCLASEVDYAIKRIRQA